MIAMPPRAPLVLIALFAAIAPMQGVILFGTGDSTANTSPPTGALTNSGWQYEGQFGAFLGTVIGANYFVTAKHIGGSVGDNFIFNNVAYSTTSVFPDPTSDLQIWQVSGTFPIHAPLYAGSPGGEVNLGLTAFGRGTQRGNAVLVGNDSHGGGWIWGTSDGVQRWGTNIVQSIATDPNYGPLLRATFDSSGGTDEAHFSAGDSGGAVFIFNAAMNRWELAGINLAVDGPFSFSASGANAFDAAMFDTTGLFVQGDSGTWIAAPNPSAFYSTEIAAHRRWIESILMQLVSAVSRKTHGSAGTFDVNLPSNGRPEIECRSGGPTGNYTIVFTFTNNVTVPAASVTSGSGTVSSFSASGKIVTVNLSGVTNQQTITVALSSVNDGTNVSDVEAVMSLLIGDTNPDRFVDAIDTSQTKSQSGKALTASNCREDVNVDGFIDSVDTAFVKSKSGGGLPSSAAPKSVSINPLESPNSVSKKTRLFIRRNLQGQ